MKIADNVHGSVELRSVEAAILDTRAFQRLRGVKHLGLGSLVFPGADYSRFAHGIGTMHVAGLMLDSWHVRYPELVTQDDVQTHRLAALLHDIGHYPFSHTFEHALKEYRAKQQLVAPGNVGDEEVALEPPTAWKHETLGRYVIEQDREVSTILNSAGIDPARVAGAIDRVAPSPLANVISSDLDADRTDYLMRTAQNTGLPYGNVDLQYLVSQMRLDRDGRIAFKKSAMRAAEHLLLSRYFDYQQVSYHKTVAGLEKVLNTAIGILLRDGVLDCSQAAIEGRLSNGQWYTFDDNEIVGQMRDHRSSLTSDLEKHIFEAVFERRPPKMVGSYEVLGTKADNRVHRLLVKGLTAELDRWHAEFGVSFWLWENPGTLLTKVGASIPQALDEDDPMVDSLEQAVRLLNDDRTSHLLQEEPRSLIAALADRGLYTIRVYALVPQGEIDLAQRIQQKVQERIDHETR